MSDDNARFRCIIKRTCQPSSSTCGSNPPAVTLAQPHPVIEDHRAYEGTFADVLL